MHDRKILTPLIFPWPRGGIPIFNSRFATGGIPQFFRPWSTSLRVSTGQTTRQRINYFYANEAFSTSEHRAPIICPDWRWYLSQCTVLCIVHTLLFFTD